MKFEIRFSKGGGSETQSAAVLLAPAIVQDAESREVLMFAWANEEALEATRKTGLATFYSRSRGKLWVKGETSGNYLRVKQILEDCDFDALIYLVEPQGPACHTGERTCFFRKFGEVDNNAS